MAKRSGKVDRLEPRIHEVKVDVLKTENWPLLKGSFLMEKGARATAE